MGSANPCLKLRTTVLELEKSWIFLSILCGVLQFLNIPPPFDWTPAGNYATAARPLNIGANNGGAGDA